MYGKQIKGMEDEVQSAEITSMDVLQTYTTFITFPLHDFIVSTIGKY
jgi:hypothetical protein